eukprot:169549-Prymnesium_polylepis.1
MYCSPSASHAAEAAAPSAGCARWRSSAAMQRGSTHSATIVAASVCGVPEGIMLPSTVTRPSGRAERTRPTVSA